MTQGTQELIDALVRLLKLREDLLTKELPPTGTYIVEYIVYRRYPSGFVGEYKYAKWQADKPMFKRNPKPRALPVKPDKDPKYTKHQHIGRIWSNTGLGMEPEVEEAYQMLHDRKTLDAIEDALTAIWSILSKFPELQAPTSPTLPTFDE